ncbi:L-dopachrome tautomerase-related protein [Nitrospira sp. M1]
MPAYSLFINRRHFILVLFSIGVIVVHCVPVFAQTHRQSPGRTVHATKASQSNQLEVVTNTDQAVGNIAFAENKDLIVSFHPFFKPEIRVARLDPETGEYTPFPNRQWNTPRVDNDWFLDDVLGIRNAADGIIWILDMGTRSDITPKLVGWNTQTNELHRLYYIPAPASNDTSQLNDFVVDMKRQLVVIADEGIARGGDGSKAALVVVDLKTGKARRLLEGQSMTEADTDSPIMIDGKPMSVVKDGNPMPIYVGADGITLDVENEWLYFAPLCGKTIYRVRMEEIANESLSPDKLAAAVVTHSDKGNNGGLSIDTAGNLYSTNVESRSIGFVSATDKKYSVLASDERMLWPDGISYNKDGYMYVSAAKVHLGAPFNDGTQLATPPYYIFRFKPLTNGIFGR